MNSIFINTTSDNKVNISEINTNTPIETVTEANDIQKEAETPEQTGFTVNTLGLCGIITGAFIFGRFLNKKSSEDNQLIFETNEQETNIDNLKPQIHQPNVTLQSNQYVNNTKSQLEQKTQKLEEEQKKLLIKNQTLEAEHQKSKATNTQLTKEIAENTNKETQLNTDIKELKKTRDEIHSSSSTLQNKKSDLEFELYQKKSEHTDLQKNLVEFPIIFNGKHYNSVNDLESYFTQLEKEQKQNQEKNQEYENQINDTEKQIYSFQQKIEKTKQQTQEFQKNITQLEKQNSQYEVANNYDWKQLINQRVCDNSANDLMPCMIGIIMNNLGVFGASNYEEIVLVFRYLYSSNKYVDLKILPCDEFEIKGNKIQIKNTKISAIKHKFTKAYFLYSKYHIKIPESEIDNIWDEFTSLYGNDMIENFNNQTISKFTDITDTKIQKFYIFYKFKIKRDSILDPDILNIWQDLINFYNNDFNSFMQEQIKSDILIIQNNQFRIGNSTKQLSTINDNFVKHVFLQQKENIIVDHQYIEEIWEKYLNIKIDQKTTTKKTIKTQRKDMTINEIIDHNNQFKQLQIRHDEKINDVKLMLDNKQSQDSDANIIEFVVSALFHDGSFRSQIVNWFKMKKFSNKNQRSVQKLLEQYI